MGYDESKTFTEAGVKRLYQYFITNLLFLFFTYILLIFQIAVISSISSSSVDPFIGLFVYSVFLSTIIFIFSAIVIWIVSDGMLRISLFAIVMICWGLSIIIGFLLLIMLFLFIMILLILLILGISYMLIGCREFSKKHQIFTIIGFCLAITYFVLFIISIFLTGVLGNMAFSLNLYTNMDLFIQIGLVVIIISVVLPILANLAFLLFIFNLSKKKKLLFIAFILGIIAPFTFSITGIISLILFFVCYKDAYSNLQTEKIKPKLKAPCPFCNREIPLDSKSCSYCGKIFNVGSKTIVKPIVKICRRCGYNNEERAVICIKCGERLDNNL
jgi:hypothetical protein